MLTNFARQQLTQPLPKSWFRTCCECITCAWMESICNIVIIPAVTHLFVIISQVFVNYLLLPPANEVWGKVMFSQVFVCPQGGGEGLCPSMHHRSHDQGGLCPGREVSVLGVSVREIPPPPRTVTSGRYASYWNALLLSKTFPKGQLQRSQNWLSRVFFRCSTFFVACRESP